tara:strand:- start:450 stop:1640 length:1191 start_codon:yes stop_codon:yes gene_type:complete
MVSEEDFELKFPAFREKAEKSALGAGHSSLLDSATEYHSTGLPEVALTLLNWLDTQENIASIVDFESDLGPLEESVDIKADPKVLRGKDPLVDRIISMSEGQGQYGEGSQTSENKSSDDSSGIAIVEAQIARHKALIHLTLGNTKEALMQTDCLAGYTDDPEAQYTATVVYSSQGMRDRTLFSLERLAQLGYGGPFSNSQYFEFVRGENVFRELQSRGFITQEVDYPLPFAHQSEDQTSLLVERAWQKAEQERRSHLVDLIVDYVNFNANPHDLEDAEAASNEAVVIDGMNGRTAGLLGLVYNRSGRYEDAFYVLSNEEKSLSPDGLLELALALTMLGEGKNAYSKLERALTFDPSLYNWLQEEAFAPLKQLESQPGYPQFMAMTNAIANAHLSPN